MGGLAYKKDVRNDDPEQSGHRQARFLQGWLNGAGGREYTAATLNELTWDNLGYRPGGIFGETSLGLIDQQYEWCVRPQGDRVQ